MKSEREIIEEIIDTARDLQLCIDKRNLATQTENDTTDLNFLINKKQAKLEFLKWLFE